ncbi:MAG: hypothetical protein ACPGNP_07765, partial [Acidimicrobiales bacterium]
PQQMDLDSQERISVYLQVLSNPTEEMQALCLNVEVLSHDGQEIEMRELDEETFRTVEELGIDISRHERGSDEEDAARAAARAARV